MTAAASFFPGEWPLLRNRLGKWLDGLAADAAGQPWFPRLSALVLSGGYGRGEGGVVPSPDGSGVLFNDLEFYMFLRGGPDEHCRAWVKRVEKEGTAELGVDVEIHAMPWEKFARGAPSMFYYDLVAAHHFVTGDERWLDGVPPLFSDATAIPPEEGTRLLYNRGSSLYSAGHAIAHDTPRRRDGYVDRIHGKILLALGDAVLTAHGLYHWSCRERHRRLRELGPEDLPPSGAKLLEWHGAGVEFKFLPAVPARTDAMVAERQGEIRALWEEVFLWLESRRLGVSIPSLPAYARFPRSLAPGESLAARLLKRLRDRMRLGVSLGLWSESSRAVLLRSLALLLHRERDAEDTRLLCQWLDCMPDPAAIHDAYRAWWLRYQ